MRVNCLILIGKTTGNCAMSQNEAKTAWNPAPVLLRFPKILQTSPKRADTVNPTDALSWHVTYLNMAACRNNYLSTPQQIKAKLFKSKQGKNTGFSIINAVTSMSYPAFSTRGVTEKGYLLLGIIPYFCPLLQPFSQ